MCGIAGFAGTPAGDTGSRLDRMLSSLARRGPDGEGRASWPGACLGHRRLSIYDLSAAGTQPMVTPDRRLAVVFNGAIYNFLDLRHELERAGFVFQSRTDTEILLHGYRAWGWNRLVARLRGMFAIGLWDDEEQTLYLLRDRLGVKPLYYRETPQGVAFASTARALADAGFADELDPAGVAEFLEFGYVTDDSCIYAGVRKVPAGTWLRWRAGRCTSERYWSVPAVAQQAAPSFDEAVAETEKRLLDAVALRLEADVPVGALLSAGIDSSLVCWAMAERGAKIAAYTVGTPGDAGDESPDAAATAKRLGIRHVVVPMDRNEPVALDELTAAYGEPFACASALGMLRVSQTIRSHQITVLLTGDGGDDVFLGYPEHRLFANTQRAARFIPSPVAQAWQYGRRLLPRRARNLSGFLTGGLRAVTDAHLGIPALAQAGLLGPRLAGRRVPLQEQPWSPASARQLLTQFLDYEHRTRFTGEYMTKVDGGAMHYALEARSPFLDQELWNYAATLPYSVRLRGNELKAVLREIVRRRLGADVANRRKQGFTIPIGKWLAGAWRDQVEELLRDPVAGRQGWIDAPAFRHAFTQAAQAGDAVPTQLWYLVVLENWLRFRQPAPTPVGALSSR